MFTLAYLINISTHFTIKFPASSTNNYISFVTFPSTSGIIDWGDGTLELLWPKTFTDSGSDEIPNLSDISLSDGVPLHHTYPTSDSDQEFHIKLPDGIEGIIPPDGIPSNSTIPPSQLPDEIPSLPNIQPPQHTSDNRYPSSPDSNIENPPINDKNPYASDLVWLQGWKYILSNYSIDIPPVTGYIYKIADYNQEPITEINSYVYESANYNIDPPSGTINEVIETTGDI